MTPEQKAAATAWFAAKKRLKELDREVDEIEKQRAALNAQLRDKLQERWQAETQVQLASSQLHAAL